MRIVETPLQSVNLIYPDRQGDDRGFFSETYSKRRFAECGIDAEFVQDNHSLSTDGGTVRGLHFQLPPRAQVKLVRVVSGAIFDVVVDLRRQSPTYGRHVAAVLSARDWNQIVIPVGFAHGLCTLEHNTEVMYKVSDFYAPEYDRGILWNDPDLMIDWPVTATEAVISDKDRGQPRLRDIADELPF